MTTIPANLHGSAQWRETTRQNQGSSGGATDGAVFFELSPPKPDHHRNLDGLPFKPGPVADGLPMMPAPRVDGLPFVPRPVADGLPFRPGPIADGLPVMPAPKVDGLPFVPPPVVDGLPALPSPIADGLPVMPGPDVDGLPFVPDPMVDGLPMMPEPVIDGLPFVPPAPSKEAETSPLPPEKDPLVLTRKKLAAELAARMLEKTRLADSGLGD